MEGEQEGRKSAVTTEGFPRKYRLGANRNYRYVYRKGKSCPSRNLVLVYLKGKDLKIGFSVSSKVGNAVVRNRIRRILREDVRRMRGRMKCGKYIFVVRTSIVGAEHMQITQEMRDLLERNRLFREEF